MAVSASAAPCARRRVVRPAPAQPHALVSVSLWAPLKPAASRSPDPSLRSRRRTRVCSWRQTRRGSRAEGYVLPLPLLVGSPSCCPYHCPVRTARPAPWDRGGRKAGRSPRTCEPHGLTPSCAECSRPESFLYRCVSRWVQRTLESHAPVSLPAAKHTRQRRAQERSWLGTEGLLSPSCRVAPAPLPCFTAGRCRLHTAGACRRRRQAAC